ncbi:HLH-domain-containing protein [Gloeophyllum trabeum ATCC 11539]|uniref:HLH-domain-containing protein n=1 Tax=Gloeophyllum trabeum (strain ATCC 11539 / FP-39264 / Madison 617) TaxID=670483 RepID=S7RLZ1_GLOTA|nr:HLH-domain-containing protein [Gloeophyllum trabeum ATCC 11539]EPQ53724.1 HLH-domain-containing protein [Gloeophyllum trabeum ATCC 11539]
MFGECDYREGECAWVFWGVCGEIWVPRGRGECGGGGGIAIDQTRSLARPGSATWRSAPFAFYHFGFQLVSALAAIALAAAADVAQSTLALPTPPPPPPPRLPTDIMSFFPAQAHASPQYKPAPIRQEGFSPAGDHPSPPFDLALPAVPDAFRKFSAASDFGDELASLMVHSPPPPPQHLSNERSTQSHSPDSHHYPHDEQYRAHTHNIFDISAPHANGNNSHNNNNNGFPTHFSLPPPSHLAQLPPHSASTSLNLNAHTPIHDAHPHHHQQSFHPNFNSTLPALNSSLRFEPEPADPTANNANNNTYDFAQHRSRSRSRGPGPGPTRTASTTRQKRNSVSGTSPPPRPGIVIPGRAVPQAWFGGDFLPTPDSLGGFGFSGGMLGGMVNGGGGGGGVNGMMVGSIGVSPKDVGLMGVMMKDEDDVAAKQAALASEKRRRRRESHNAVERRRRDNINEKISELATLIPECMLDVNAPASTPTESDLLSPPEPPTPGGAAEKDKDKDKEDKDGEGAGVKANKGMILRKSVEYIRYLQQLVSAQASRNRDLEQQLQAYRAGSAPPAGSSGKEEGPEEMVLHEDAGFSLPTPPDHQHKEEGRRGRYRSGSRLESVDEGEGDVEMEVETESEDGEEERGRRGRDGRVGGEAKVLAT